MIPSLSVNVYVSPSSTTWPEVGREVGDDLVARRPRHVPVADERADEQVRHDPEASPRYSPVGSKPPVKSNDDS